MLVCRSTGVLEQFSSWAPELTVLYVVSGRLTLDIGRYTSVTSVESSYGACGSMRDAETFGYLGLFSIVDRGLSGELPEDLQGCRDQPPPERRLNCLSARDSLQSFLLLLCRT